MQIVTIVVCGLRVNHLNLVNNIPLIALKKERKRDAILCCELEIKFTNGTITNMFRLKYTCIDVFALQIKK